MQIYATAFRFIFMSLAACAAMFTFGPNSVRAQAPAADAADARAAEGAGVADRTLEGEVVTRPGLNPARLAAQMTITRDEWGVPHIEAETLPAAVYAFGYAQGRDYPLGVMQRVLAARGELSAVFGPRLTERDFFARRIRLHESSDRRFSELDPEVQDLMAAFAMGVNAAYEEQRDALPPWVGQITAVDVLAVSRHALLAFAFNPERTMAALRPHLPEGALEETGDGATMPGPADVPRQHPVPAEGSSTGDEEMDEAASAFNAREVIEAVRAFTTAPDYADRDEIAAALTGPAAFDPLTDEFGSNMWALGPEKSESGNALLMGNPHLPWELTWYEGHLRVPSEDYELYGVSFVGGLIPTIAFNDRLGWSHTVNYPDLEDIYVFELADEAESDAIIVDGAPQALSRLDVVLDVREGDRVDRQERSYYESPFGPVIFRDADHAYVVKSSALSGLDFTKQWLEMGRAKNLEEFQAALAINAVPMFNTIYADADGNIYYHWMATLPVRAEGERSVEPVRVTRADEIWTAVHPAGDLPQLVNPEGGYVQNSNDPPYYTTLEQILDPAQFPAYMPEPRLRLRTQHGLELIRAEEKFTLDEVIEAKHSMKMLLADRMRDDLVEAARAQGTHEPELAEAAEALAAWDGTVAADSRGGVLFHDWWARYEAEADEPWAEPWDRERPMETPRGLGDADLGVALLRDAAAAVREKWGALDVAWGEVHRLRRGDLDLPMNGGPGAIGCFRVIDYAEAQDGKLVATGGDGWVMAIEFTSPPTARTVLIHGSTENPESPPFNAQAERFIQGDLKPVEVGVGD